MSALSSASDLDVEAMLRRLHLPTIRRLYAELEDRAEEEGLGYRDYLAILLAEEIAHRAQTRVERSVRKAKFPFLAPIEDFDFTFQSSVKLQLLGSFLGPELVTEGRNLILSGPTGTGKTRLAISIAYRAIQNGFEARFTTAAELIERLSNAARTGRLETALHDYLHPHVLVLDEVGYLSLTDNAANVLFQVVNERYLATKPMLFTTNKPLAAWGHVLHDPDLAEAILDRVLERGRHIQLRGSSYRTRHHRSKEENSEKPPAPSTGPRARISGTTGPENPEPTAIPETEMARVRKRLQVFCDRVPPHARGKVWYDWRVRGNQVTMAEKRPAWWEGAGADEITVHEFVRFQYDPETHRWMLKWSDRNGQFHPYEGFESVRSFERLVDEVDADPTHIFFG